MIQLRTPEAPATRKQLWLLHILSKQDTRDYVMTMQEASDKIGELKGKPTKQTKRPLVNPHATAIKQDKQLRTQQHYDSLQAKSPEPVKVPKGWQILTVGNSVVTIKADAPDKLVAEIKKSQEITKPRKFGPYPSSHYFSNSWGCRTGSPEAIEAYTEIYGEPTIDILVDGKLQQSINGNYKAGVIKAEMAKYCKPGEGKIRLVKI